MKKIFATAGSFLSFLISISTPAQSQTICGNDLILQEILADPNLKAENNKYNAIYIAENMAMAKDLEQAKSKGTSTKTYEKAVIPVVFHIVLNENQIQTMGGTTGILNRINSQLEELNKDYSASNTDISNVPAAFKSRIGNANLEFKLAKINDQGKAQTGIVYHILDTSIKGFDVGDPSLKRAPTGSAPWNNERYVNIWISNINPQQNNKGQVLGYAFNSTYAQQNYHNSALAGIAIHYLTLGRKLNFNEVFYSSQNTLGRTLSHEMGHYFNIWHIWGKNTPAGSKSCTDDDGISDTPLQEAANMSCPGGYKHNCSQQPDPGGEMYMNYMDYSTDRCTIMFSTLQVARMRSELEPGGQLQHLGKDPSLTEWPTDVSVMEYNNKVAITPNPSNGRFFIQLLDKYNKLENITILSSVGQVIYQTSVTDQSKQSYDINITNLPKGVYITQLHFDEGIISRKVIIQ